MIKHCKQKYLNNMEKKFKKMKKLDSIYLKIKKRVLYQQ